MLRNLMLEITHHNQYNNPSSLPNTILGLNKIGGIAELLKTHTHKSTYAHTHAHIETYNPVKTNTQVTIM